ncbi:hypothetical protein GQ53DRAFT_628985, partial [Thozetella sp. PMI_491]
YWCTCCDTKFQHKFDWKRHEDEFHEPYKRYLCPSCDWGFWSATIFNRHPCCATTRLHAYHVVQYTTRKTAWACGFCAAFLPTRDRYFDHVTRHYEAGSTKAHWNHSHVIYGLLHQPRVHTAWEKLLTARYGDLSSQRALVFKWDPESTGRAQGFHENGNPGKLQDLLEFFDEAKDDEHLLTTLAHDQATV